MAANKSYFVWSKEDNAWLFSNHESMSIRRLSEYLERTPYSIRKQLTLLNCARQTHRVVWAQEDINYLIDNYENISFKNMSKILHRSVKGIYQKLESLNISFTRKIQKKWTKEEEKQFLDLYNRNKTLDEIKDTMGRSINSLNIRLRRHLKLRQKGKKLGLYFRSNNFYMSMRMAIQNLSTRSECCMCGYNLFIDLHHINGNRKNNLINNIASLCPNHHREVEEGLHKDKELYCIWWRINADGSISEKVNNKKEIEILKELVSCV